MINTERIYEIDFYGKYNVKMVENKYANNNHLAVQLVEEDGMPYATLTVNLENSKNLKENEQYIDTNNCPFAEHFLISNRIAYPTGEYGISGFCVYPVFKFYEEKLLTEAK